MGLLTQFLNRLAPVYNTVREGVSSAYHKAGRVVHGVGMASDFVDSILNQGKNIPFLRTLAKEIQNNDIYSTVRGLIKDTVETYDDLGAFGSTLDSAIRSKVPEFGQVNINQPETRPLERGSLYF